MSIKIKENYLEENEQLKSKNYFGNETIIRGLN
jgi:hypothetical protein